MSVEDGYAQGLRDGRLASLEKEMIQVSADISKLKAAGYMLYGAIILVQFLPVVTEVFQ